MTRLQQILAEIERLAAEARKLADTPGPRPLDTTGDDPPPEVPPEPQP